MINKYLQEADENKIFYSTESYHQKLYMLNIQFFDGVAKGCLEISHTVLSK